jgi:hypothetical protein
MSFIEVSNVDLVYRGNSQHRREDGTLVLAGIELAIEEGSFVSVVGPSGCGLWNHTVLGSEKTGLSISPAWRNCSVPSDWAGSAIARRGSFPAGCSSACNCAGH